MKIDKTEKEFREAFACAAQAGSLFTDQETAHLFAAVKAAFDLEFKPEKPELPKEVFWDQEYGLATPIAKRVARPLTRAEGREAAARYNAVTEILRVLDYATSVKGRWHSVGDACRELHDILKREGMIPCAKT